MKLTAHPFAALFPPMTAADLADLVADLGENALAHPVMLDADGMIIDGIDRLRACELAGVDPEFEKIEGDPVAFILAANMSRRDMSAGQKAMAVALAHPALSRRGRGKKTPAIAGVTKQRLSNARFVLRHSRPLAEAVLAGAIKLDAAFRQVGGDRRARNGLPGAKAAQPGEVNQKLLRKGL